MKILTSLEAHFGDLPDPRITAKCDHSLLNIIIIALCATIAGADSWQEIEWFGKSKQAWLSQWLDLPSGIPSHDTFERVFRRLNTQEFEARFIAWTQAVFRQTEGQVIAIDGKAVRGTTAGLHLVSAWASVNGLCLGQCKVAKKTNEITVIPDLLDMLHLKGCIVTLDALGCQKTIAEKIVAQQADYVLAVKGNQGNLHGHIESRFALTDDPRFLNHPQPAYSETVERGHGRHETRQCWVLRDQAVAQMGWPQCQTLVRVTCQREYKGKLEQETRYFISTLPAQPALLLGCVRAHWSIENSFHWVLDVVFQEDQSRTRHDIGAENLASLRRMALNLIKQHPGKGTLKGKRFKAALNEDFLLEILQS
jgi:predicted transposase YbfD/YdcC